MERNDVPLNVNGPRSLVDRTDARVEKIARKDPESKESRAGLVRRAIRYYLDLLDAKEAKSGSAELRFR